MTKNLTEGNPLKLIVLFSLPLLAGNLFQQAYNMVDTAIVGLYLGKDALAGVGASTSVQFMILGFCMGISTGFSIPVSQAFGAGDHSLMRQHVYVGTLTLAAFSAVITVLCTVFCTQILNLLKTPENVWSEAYSYLFVLFLGIPFSLFYNYLSGILRAVGDSKTPFYFLIVASILNLVLDILFIVRMDMKVAGAALATVISQGISGILTLVFILRKVTVLHIRKKERVWNGQSFVWLVSCGIPMGLQFSITAIGSMVLQTANNALGSIYVSAFTAVARVKQMFFSPIDAIGSAVSTFAGQNYGARKSARIRKGIFQGTALSILYSVAACLVFFFWGRNLLLVFIRSDETFLLDCSSMYLSTIGFFFWAIGFLNVLRPTVQCLGFSGRAVFSGFFEMIARCVVGFGFVSEFGFRAVCYADPFAWCCAVAYILPTLLWALGRIDRQFAELD